MVLSAAASVDAAVCVRDLEAVGYHVWSAHVRLLRRPTLSYWRCSMPGPGKIFLGHLPFGGGKFAHRRPGESVPLWSSHLASRRRTSLADPQEMLVPIRALSSHEVSYFGLLWIPEPIMPVLIRAERRPETLLAASSTSRTRPSTNSIQLLSFC
jgi:hypothetical protein